MSDFLYQKLEEIDEQHESLKTEEFCFLENLQTEGDALLFQFYCGNWSASVQRMRDENVSWRDLLQYIEEGELESPDGDWSQSHGHFDRAFWGELADTLARPQ